MPMSSEQRLWRHVLLAILTDLQSASEHGRRDRDFARRWVGHYPSRDFQLVCELAGLDAECVHRYFRQMAGTGRSDCTFVTDEQAPRDDNCGSRPRDPKSNHRIHRRRPSKIEPRALFG